MDVLDQVRRYLDKIPPAVSGAGGHNQTFRVACVLVQGFGLSPDEARPLMHEYSARCQPPWNEKDIDHKLRDAERAPNPKGHAYLLKNSGGLEASPARTSTVPQTSSGPRSSSLPNNPSAATYDVTVAATLPFPIPNGATALLLAAFHPGEHIRFCLAETAEDGRELPRDAGITLSREHWLARLESARGDPNAFLRSSERNGIFISINPMTAGGTRDADVTAFRHCLLEFDQISLAEQWQLITQSKIPVTAVIHSGRRSLHAWVRVDATDRADYDARVKLLLAHFSKYQPDPKNKNPSRFSRLPNCVRFDSRQELLALNLGADSFAAWKAALDLDQLGQEIQVKQLLEFVPAEDPNVILGNRWLCRGGSCLFIGQSGIGKSSLAMQLAILWALERPAFGICPSRSLRSLFVQAENDLGDLAEMFQGVWLGMNLPGPESPDTIRRVQQQITIRTVTTHTGYAFAEALRRLIEHYQPDLVWLDPLLSFIGDDISKQSVCSQFLRNWLNPISKSTGVTWMILHHTGKPPKDPKSKSHWKSGDYAYEGTGSSELTNWARAVCVLHRLDSGPAGEAFELKLAKRGPRAGARDLLHRRTTSIFLRHSTRGICWQQTDAPVEDETEELTADAKSPTRKSGPPRRNFDYDAFLSSIAGEHFTISQLVDRVCRFSGIAERTAYSNVIPELKRRMRFDLEFKVFSVSS
jgi:RecA-family ATPase